MDTQSSEAMLPHTSSSWDRVVAVLSRWSMIARPRLLIPLATLFLIAGEAFLIADEAAAAGPCPPEPRQGAATASTGYDRWLRGYDYPYDVKYFQVGTGSAAQCMAYMDVTPAQPNGQVVMLLHGKNFSGAYWKRTAEVLLEHGYRVVMPDQIGFGKSSKPTDMQYSFARLALDTARLLDSIQVERVSVVGHSMGGMLATRWALQYPDRTAALVLVNPIGLEDYRQSVPYLGVDAWQEQMAKQGPESVRRYMQESYFHGTWQSAYDPLLEIQAGWAKGPDRLHMARVSALTQDMIYTQPVVYDFSSVRAPTLLVIGQEDHTAPGKADVSPEVAAKLGDYRTLGERTAKAIANAKLVKLDGVGHLPQFEAFERWQAALLPFLPAARRSKEGRR
jgi:pimeloyl-ACP methyl ester carboxylesterase